MRAGSPLTRRRFLTEAASVLAGVAAASIGRIPGALAAPGAAGSVVVRMRSGEGGARVAFDPVGLHVKPGTALRWVLESGAHSTTAYHPRNGRPRRIPEGAAAWDSGILFEPGARFVVRLDLPGVYDVFCLPHEAAGMVGRIVVGDPGIDFEVPGWARSGADAPGLPGAAGAGFPSLERIVTHGAISNL